MEYLSTGNIITIVVNAIFLVAFVVRMDSKVKFQDKEINDLKNELKETEKEIKDHISNNDIHFSLAVSNQVQKRTDEKFNDLEKQITKMDTSINDKFKELKEVIKGIAERK